MLDSYPGLFYGDFYTFKADKSLDKAMVLHGITPASHARIFRLSQKLSGFIRAFFLLLFSLSQFFRCFFFLEAEARAGPKTIIYLPRFCLFLVYYSHMKINPVKCYLLKLKSMVELIGIYTKGWQTGVNDWTATANANSNGSTNAKFDRIFT